jgi:uncharacterized protein (TIGR03067 family)
MLARQLSLLLVLAAPALAVFAQDDDAKADMKKLQGTWNVVSMSIDGNKIPIEMAKIVMVFKDNNVTFTVNDKTEAEGTFTLKAGVDPKQFDLVHGSGKYKGKLDMSLYILDGDTLKIAGYTGETSFTKRPAAFPKEGDKEYDVYTLKRAKS